MKLTKTIFFSVALAAVAAGNDQTPPPVQKNPILLQNGTVHTVSGASIEGGSVLLMDGKISDVLKKDQKLNMPQGTQLIDVSGKHVYPGLIAANTVLGLVEIRAVRSTRDMVEPGALNPNVRAEVSVNPDSELIPVARANGVLTALVVPQASGGGLVAGTSALMALDGWTWEAMTVRAPVGLHVQWPRVTFGTSVPKDEEAKKALEKQRKESKRQLRILDEFFESARAYQKAKAAKSEGFKRDLRLEGVQSVLAKETPIFAHANDIGRIQSAVDFATRNELKLVIVGGQDAWRIAPLLKEQDVAVVTGPVQNLPSQRWEPYDTPFQGPKRLLEAGVRVCIAGEGSSMAAMNERNVPYQAAQAAAFGLPKDEALKMVTLYAAQILGAGDRLGSIEPGKDATVIVTDGDPLEVRTNVELAFIQGRPVDLKSRHTQFFEKYKEKYRQQE